MSSAFCFRKMNTEELEELLLKEDVQPTASPMPTSTPDATPRASQRYNDKAFSLLNLERQDQIQAFKAYIEELMVNQSQSFEGTSCVQDFIPNQSQSFEAVNDITEKSAQIPQMLSRVCSLDSSVVPLDDLLDPPEWHPLSWLAGKLSPTSSPKRRRPASQGGVQGASPPQQSFMVEEDITQGYEFSHKGVQGASPLQQYVMEGYITRSIELSGPLAPSLWNVASTVFEAGSVQLHSWKEYSKERFEKLMQTSGGSCLVQKYGSMEEAVDAMHHGNIEKGQCLTIGPEGSEAYFKSFGVFEADEARNENLVEEFASGNLETNHRTAGETCKRPLLLNWTTMEWMRRKGSFTGDKGRIVFRGSEQAICALRQRRALAEQGHN
jgi:hypothetical protein